MTATVYIACYLTFLPDCLVETISHHGIRHVRRSIATSSCKVSPKRQQNSSYRPIFVWQQIVYKWRPNWS